MLNSVNIIGRLVADPKINETKEGIKVSTFTIAVNVNKDLANFFDVKGFGLAGVEAIHKGDLVGISGKLSQDRYQAKDGTTKSRVEIVASVIEFVNVKKPVESK